MLFREYLDKIGRENLGWKCRTFMDFPILVKLIDAKEPLSIQVHPDDEYALEKENEYGKNEMWYVLDAEPGAYIYCGFGKSVSREEVERRIQDHTVTEILNKIPVNRGRCLFYFYRNGTCYRRGAADMRDTAEFCMYVPSI